MASARYWKLAGIVAHGGGDVELSELKFYDDATPVSPPVTLTANTGVNGSAGNLLDDNFATTFRFNPTQPGASLIADFGGSYSPRVTALRLGSSTSQSRFLAQVDLYCSSDAATWAKIASLGPFAWPGSNTLTAEPTGGDLYYANVSTLLHGNGVNGATTITDNAPTPKSFTAGGAAQISTAQSKFGGASMRFQGVNDYFARPASNDFAFPEDFTVEFFAWKSADGAGGYDSVLTTDTSSGSAVNGWMCELSSSRGFALIHNGAEVISYAVNPNDSTWRHWAACRSGSVVTLFRDGTPVASTTYTQRFAALGPFGVGGSNVSAAYCFNGYLDEVRVTKGVARYLDAFTPPSAPFEDSGNTAGFEPVPLYVQPASATAKFASSPVAGSVGAKVVEATRSARDMYLAGRGSISATVKEDGTPTDTPVRRKVRLFRDRDGLVVRETWSNATTGAYTFSEIDENETYSVVSYDHNNNFRAVIADRITPTVA